MASAARARPPALLLPALAAAAAAAPDDAARALAGLGSAPRAFGGCADSAGAGARARFISSANGNNGAARRGGLGADVAGAGAGCAGIGFPARPATMIGSHAIVIRACAACASGAAVEGYVLAGKTPPANAPGSWPLRDAAAAAAPGGRLLAASAADLPLAPAALAAAPAPAIFALGPLNAAGDGLAPHFPGGFPCGATTLDFSRAGAAAAAATAGRRWGSKESSHTWLVGVGWTLLLGCAVAARAGRARPVAAASRARDSRPTAPRR
jgi:hypothetical protein